MIIRTVYEDDEVVKFELGFGYVCIIDQDSVAKIKDYHWRCLKSGYGRLVYACATIDKRVVLLHRFLLNPPKGKVVDHINGDPMDNRVSNLRLATQQENTRNRRPSKNTKSRFKGVSREERAIRNPWIAYIRINGKHVRLGSHPTEEMAAAAYNTAALQHFGEFAKLNEGV